MITLYSIDSPGNLYDSRDYDKTKKVHKQKFEKRNECNDIPKIIDSH